MSDNKKSTIALVNVIMLTAILAAGFLYLIMLPRETVSNEENRNLARFPEFTADDYISGRYTEDIADYYDDTVPGRSRIKSFIARYIIPAKGLKYGGGDSIALYGSAPENNDRPPETVPPATAPPVTSTAPAAASTSAGTVAAALPETTAVPETTTPPADDGELTNNIVVVNHRGITLYGGGWGGEVEYARYLNEYKARLGGKVRVYSMVLPTAGSYYMPEKYQSLIQSEKDDFDRMAANFDGVIYVDAYSALLHHTDEAIYSRTDHHWQPLGAYYAAQQFAHIAGVGFPPLSEYETVTLPGYVGTLYGYTQSADLLDNPEDFVYYVPKTAMAVTRYKTNFTSPSAQNLFIDPANLSSSSYYLVFGTDEAITHVETECCNGRTLIIFKDSYGNALLPVLTSSFENIYLCDIRYFELDPIKFAEEVGATDMLFAMCSYSAVGGNKQCIINNLSN